MHATSSGGAAECPYHTLAALGNNIWCSYSVAPVKGTSSSQGAVIIYRSLHETAFFHCTVACQQTCERQDKTLGGIVELAALHFPTPCLTSDEADIQGDTRWVEGQGEGRKLVRGRGERAVALGMTGVLLL